MIETLEGIVSTAYGYIDVVAFTAAGYTDRLPLITAAVKQIKYKIKEAVGIYK